MASVFLEATHTCLRAMTCPNSRSNLTVFGLSDHAHDLYNYDKCMKKSFYIVLKVINMLNMSYIPIHAHNPCFVHESAFKNV